MSEPNRPSNPVPDDATEDGSPTPHVKPDVPSPAFDPAPERQTPTSVGPMPITYPAINMEADMEAEARIHRMSRRSFLWGAMAVGTTYVGWRWLISRPDANGIAWPFRRALEVNEDLAKDYFGSQRLLPTFARAMAREPRPNGFEGMPDLNPDVENAEEFDSKAWRLSVIGLVSTPDNSNDNGSNTGENSASDASPAPSEDKKGKAKAPSDSSTKHKQTSETDTKKGTSDNGGSEESSGSSGEEATSESDSSGQSLMLTLDDIKKLPKVTQTVEFKCIEGWSEIVNWTGARFIDFAAKYGPATKSGDPPDVKNKPQDLMDYVSMETPDGGYYVGLDIASALHPQTLLCYEMNGEPLTVEHGGPLRLVIPVKYGIKNIKRIGTIRFTNERPKDFWAEQGYDWYAGH